MTTALHLAQLWSPGTTTGHLRVPTLPLGGATPRIERLAAPEPALSPMVGTPRIECAGGHGRSNDRRITEGERRCVPS